MIRVFESFAGYGSQALALRNIGIDYEVVGISEIDKYALKAYEQIHGHCPNFGDISKIDWSQVPDFDLFTMSSPCQDFSIAGMQKGGEEGSGTRSSRLWWCRRAIVEKQPKYILFENVKGLVSQQFLPYFLKWQNELSNLGYTNFTQVLNAKDYGVAQNRERVFMVSILGNAWYNFPEKIRLMKCIADYLENDVDDKYYLSEKLLNGFKIKSENTEYKFKPHTEEDKHIATLTARYHKCAITDPYIKIVGNLDVAHEEMSRVYDENGLSPTINTSQGDGRQPKILQRGRGFNKGGEHDICPTISKSSWENNNYLNADRIRRLTPRECWRLMGVSDSDFDKLHDISDTQLYKMAGNSIVVPVLEGIFKNLFCNA